MLADQTMLEVSASAMTKWKAESTLLSEAMQTQLKRSIRHHVSDLLFDLLVSNHSGRRETCKLLTLEPFPPQQSVGVSGSQPLSDASTTFVQFLRSKVDTLIESDVVRICREAGDFIERLIRIQMNYCCDVFIPTVVDAQRFVVDRELKEIFEQLRLQRALVNQARDANIDLDVPRRGSSAASSSCDPGPIPLKWTDSLIPCVSLATADGLAAIVGDEAHSDTASPSPRVGVTTPASSSTAIAVGNGSARTLGSRGVVSLREHQQALRQSLEREKLLHDKLDAMQRALQERAAKEHESVEQLTRRMEEAQATATLEIQQQLRSFQSDLESLRDTNAQLEMRLKCTMEVAAVMDALVGRLNTHVACLRELMIREDIGSALLSRVDRALDEVRTTCCCRGRPMLVEGGAWTFGGVPPTREWLKELQSATPATPTFVCSEQQHDILQRIVDFCGIEARCKKLEMELQSAKEEQNRQASRHLSAMSEVKANLPVRMRELEDRLWKAMSENVKLRAALARSMEVETLTKGNSIQNRNRPMSARCRSQLSGGNTIGGNEQDDHDVRLQLARCRTELNAALADLNILGRRPVETCDVIREPDATFLRDSRSSPEACDTAPPAAQQPSATSTPRHDPDFDAEERRRAETLQRLHPAARAGLTAVLTSTSREGPASSRLQPRHYARIKSPRPPSL